jgi:hypothetical protein
MALASITLLSSWRKMTKCGIACPDRRTEAPGSATVRLPQRVLINFLQTEDTALVLVAVFIPTAIIPGITGCWLHREDRTLRARDLSASALCKRQAGSPLASDPPVQAKSEKSQGRSAKEPPDCINCRFFGRTTMLCVGYWIGCPKSI